MLSIESAKPSAQKILNHIEDFEQFCLGKRHMSPAAFRDINQELSIGAVLLIGKYRYYTNNNEQHILWKGLDDQEYDLGSTSDMNVMRNYPGFHATRTLALGNDQVANSQIIENPKRSGSLCQVTMNDGSTGIGPNYRMALRNAALKMHLKKQFNMVSLSSLWNGLWGNA